MDYQTSVREYNNARILSLLRRHAPLSRADISRYTNLNRSTVSSIIDELLGDGFVREIGLRQVSTGRPSIMLEIDADHYGVLGIDVQHGAACVTLSNLLGEVFWQQNVQPADLPSNLRTGLDLALSQCSRLNLAPAGVGIAASSGLSEAAIQDTVHDLPALSSLPVVVAEQTQAATIGQHYLGRARGVENFIYLTDDDGPKAVFVINGRIHRGSTDHAGHIAHLSVGTMGARCNCGKQGCWNPRVNPESIARRLQTNQPFEAIVEDAENGNVQAQEEIQALCLALGRGISYIVSIVDPRMVVLGGYLGHLKVDHLQLIHMAALYNCSEHLREDLDIALVEETEETRHIGAISLVLNHLYQDLVI